jgi:hypothetical protein
VAADPAAPCVLAFRFAPGAPPGLALHVNAVPVPMEVGSAAGGEWLATATLSPAVLRLGAPSRWDLVAAEGTPVLLGLSVAPMAGTALPAQDNPVAAVVARAEPLAEGRRIRWDLSNGIGPEEGPFEDLGIPAGVRWVVARSARLAVECSAGGAARLALRYRSLLPRQGLRVVVNGALALEREAPGGGLREALDLVLALTLRAGLNEVSLDFTGAVREPGTGRELVLLVEHAALD